MKTEELAARLNNHNENLNAAFELLLKKSNHNWGDETIIHLIDCGYLSTNECRNGTEALWYFDGNDETEVCININTLSEMNKDDIDAQLL